MNRRTFLTRSSLALAGGLLIGDEAMELFARLTHQRKSFPSAGMPMSMRFKVNFVDANDYAVRGPDGRWTYDFTPLYASRAHELTSIIQRGV